MDHFGQDLVKIRKANGYKSAKSFYEVLAKKGLECNYQYFVKIEKGAAFPSSAIVNQIAKCLKTKDANILILSFCRNQFSSFDYLFKEDNQSDEEVIEVASKAKQGQRYLSVMQINSLAQTKSHYFLFLILTLSRSALKISELKTYAIKKSVVNDLIKAEVAFEEDGLIYARSTEFRFPNEVSETIKKAYGKFDDWDMEFGRNFKFQNLVNKMMIRRISPRYLSLIKNQIDSISDIVRLSDESDNRYNNEVLHLHISLNRGQLPG
ncbi:hypothetical protein M902_0907 [Bacteriovorax sp. BAL6_X]|uniref:hypothetical protein n=1 Tax=Bacteriovorax sp. BAL6_X TaxID=1201290 RepID=UPI000386235D|nr:hypothetical protein [Bacteriovorax sp. BAL6_X]EPZ49863.1 hypothetical protein M902_0907 [Bacteriovorax sp. BAL6_X]